MKITVSKFFPAKWEYDDLAADGFRPRVLPLTSGSNEKEKYLVWKNGGGR